jgi:hypothetical protein
LFLYSFLLSRLLHALFSLKRFYFLNDAGSPEDAELSHQHRSSRYSPDLQALWLVQDLMSAQALLGLFVDKYSWDNSHFLCACRRGCTM